MASPFILRATQSDSDGPENDVMSDSEFEHLSASGEEEALRSLHFWYGRQLLQQHLASNIAKNASPTTSVCRLDWSLTQAVVTFPYLDILAKLRQQELQDVYSPSGASEEGVFTECVVGLGSAALSRLDRPDWMTTFLAGEIEAARAPPTDTDNPPDDLDVRLASDHDGRADLSSGDERRLPRYTMALKEFHDAGGREPHYTYSHLSLDPPQFKAVLQLGNSIYEGSAGTKKAAKHLASKSACHDLELLP